jgi:hypothetical protein
VLVGLGADGVFVDEFLGLGGEQFGGDLVSLVGQVLLTVYVPVDHHPEHDHPPYEGDPYPRPFDLVDGLLPP